MKRKLVSQTSICISILALLAQSVLFFNPVSAAHEAIEPTSIIVRYKNNPAVKTIEVGSKDTIESLLKRVRKDPKVLYAEPNYIYQAAALTPDDAYFSDQWYLKRIKAPEGWSVKTDSPQVVVAVIDSGVYIQHPDLRQNLWTNAREIEGNKKDDDGNGLVDDRNGWDFVNNVSDPGPKFKKGFTESGILHGTIIAGIIGASGNNAQGISGVTWRTKIMSLKVLDDAGNGETSRVVKAIDYAVANGANIINLSFVGYASSEAMKESIERAVAAGVVVIAPAGNEQSGGHGTNVNTKPIYPACYKNSRNERLVIGVAATDGIDQKAEFSGYGSNCVSLAAPGMSFFSTSVYAPNQTWQGKPFNSYYDGYWSGTSVAVPLVSGALALVQSANPLLSTKESVDILLNSTDDINALNPAYRGQLGKGRLNLVAALVQARVPLQSKTASVALAPGSQIEPFVEITDLKGEVGSRFLAYDRGFRGGVNLIAADIDGDKQDEIITAPTSNLESDIKIFNSQGKFIHHFLAYPASYRGGVNLASIDLNNDGKYEIITAPAFGANADIKIFSSDGKLLRSFLAYPRSSKSGAVVTAGNVMGGAEPEIVVGTGKGGIPEVRIFSTTGKLLQSFIAGDRNLTGGLRLSLLDIDHSTRRQTAEILITRQSGSPEGIITDYRGTIRRRFQVYYPSFKGDVKVTTADINQDGTKEIISFPGPGGGPHIKFFTHLGDFQQSFYAYSPQFTGGVNATIFYTH